MRKTSGRYSVFQKKINKGVSKGTRKSKADLGKNATFFFFSLRENSIF